MAFLAEIAVAPENTLVTTRVTGVIGDGGVAVVEGELAEARAIQTKLVEVYCSPPP